MFKINIYTFTFLLILTTNSFATSIVAVRTPNAIFLGSDSKIQHKGDSTNVPDNSCKIFQVGQYFFALAGFTEAVIGSEDSFIISSMIRKNFKEEKNLKYNIEQFEQNVKNDLPKFLTNLKRKKPDLYSIAENFIKKMAPGAPIQVIFCGIENDKLFTYHIDFFIAVINDSFVITAKDFPSFEPLTEDVEMVRLGYNKERPINRNTYSVKGNGVKELIIDLIQAEIDKHPNEVGAPINILKISKDGIKWLTQNKVCSSL